MANSLIQWENPLAIEIENSGDQDRINEYEKVQEILKLQADREYCSFEFQNNLKDRLNLKYLKISHVFEGREAFVYHACDLKHNGKFYVEDYAIGIELGSDEENRLKNDQSLIEEKGFVIKKNKVDKDKNEKKDFDNVYDRLYVQFVIEENGKQTLYHHCYDQLFNNELYDLFNSEGFLKREYISLLHIRLFFDPLYNDHKMDDFRLRLSISSPMKDTIKIVRYNS